MKCQQILLLTFFSFATSIAIATDSTTAPPSFSSLVPLKRCCTTTVSQTGIYIIDCYAGPTWSCNPTGYGDTSDYSGTFGCQDGYVLTKVATYTKYNYYTSNNQMMIRAAWCAPLKYDCKWIPTTDTCAN